MGKQREITDAQFFTHPMNTSTINFVRLLELAGINISYITKISIICTKRISTIKNVNIIKTGGKPVPLQGHPSIDLEKIFNESGKNFELVFLKV